MSKATNFLKNNRKRLLSSAKIMGIITLIIIVFRLVIGDYMERKSYDILVGYVGGRETEPSENIKLILIDENSMKYGQGIGLGNWPWPRWIYARILEFLNYDPNAKPKGIFFDILFTESDKNPENDSAFRDGIAMSENVYHNILLMKEKDRKTPHAMPPDITTNYKLRIRNTKAFHMEFASNNDYKLPIPCLRAYIDDCSVSDQDPKSRELLANSYPIAKGISVASFKPDVDGVHRKGKIIFRYGDIYFPSFSLAAIQALYPNTQLEILPDNTIKVADFQIPIDEEGNYYVNYYHKRIEMIQMAAVFQSAAAMESGEGEVLVQPSEFKDKIVIIGCSAVGCQDLKNTPVSSTFPGPEIHANIISNILQGNHIRREPRSLTYSFMFMIIVISVLSVFVGRSALVQVGVPFILMAVYFAASIWLFATENIMTSFLDVISSSFLASSISFVYLSMTEGAERRKYSKVLGNMVDPSIVSEALKDLDALKKGGEKVITAFFSDVASFSTISEKLSSEDLAALLNEYLSAMTVILKKHHGTLDKYIGDAIVGIFGAPLDQPQNALDAAHASVEMSRKLEELRREWKEKNAYIEDARNMDFRIGLNTGRAKVGFMGTDTLASYTMMGDTVNLAARLEAAGKDYGVRTLLSETTKKEIESEFTTRKLDAVRVKGKNEPVLIFELLGTRNSTPQNLIECAGIYEEGFHLYLEQKFEQAIAKFREAEKAKQQPDKSSRMLIERCEDYIVSPPPDNWDGVFTRTHK